VAAEANVAQRRGRGAGGAFAAAVAPLGISGKLASVGAFAYVAFVSRAFRRSNARSRPSASRRRRRCRSHRRRHPTGEY